MIADHGDAVEADLAFRGIDLRDLWRPGTGLTLRRLYVLILSLPHDARLWADMHAAEEKAKKPAVEKIRERQEHYARQKAAAQPAE